MLVGTCIAAICMLVAVILWQRWVIRGLRVEPLPVVLPSTPTLNEPPLPYDGMYIGLRNLDNRVISFRKLHGERPEVVEKAHGRDVPTRYHYVETAGSIHYYEERD